MSVAVTSNSGAAGVDLERLLSVSQLPALPQSAIKILELAKDLDNGPTEYAKPIECDPGLTSQVLRFVNSSYFGFSREISSIKQAITLVGVRTIKNFTLWSAVFSLMPNPKCGPFDLKLLWQDSLRRALFARGLVKLLGQKDGEEPFAAALLQDMAVPLLAKEVPQEYLAFLNQRTSTQQHLSELERTRFGWDHAEAAAKMAKQWNLPDELVEPIRRHTQLDELLAEGGAKPAVVAVAFSSLLPAGADSAWKDKPQFEAAWQKLFANCGTSCVEFLAQVDKEFADFAPVLKLSVPAQTLVAWYEQG